MDQNVPNISNKNVNLIDKWEYIYIYVEMDCNFDGWFNYSNKIQSSKLGDYYMMKMNCTP